MRVIAHVDAHDSWTTDLDSFVIDKEVITTLTNTGDVYFWTVDVYGKSILLQHMFSTGINNAISISVCLDGRTFLVVGKNKWALYSLMGCKLIVESKSNGCINGYFIDPDVFQIWNKNGNVKIYQTSMKLNITIPIVEAVSDILIDSSIEKLEDYYLLIGEYNSNFTGNTVISNDSYLAVVGNNGSLSVLETESIIGNEEYEPAVVCSYKEAWNENDNYQVTVSTVIESSFKLVRGFESGHISISNLPTMIDPIQWKAHKSDVTCLLVLNEEYQDYNYLVTASTDFYVKIWNLDIVIEVDGIEQPELVKRFAYHSGPVRDLFASVPTSNRYIWNDRFFSVGEDAAIILYHISEEPYVVHVFGAHPAPIETVKWNLDQDYLIVKCIDGGVSIWEMSEATGELQQCIYGKLANDILSNANELSKYKKQNKYEQIFERHITGFNLETSKNSSIQTIVLNIRYISNNLYNNFVHSSTGDVDMDMILPISLENTKINSFKAFSLLLPWGLDEELDHIIATKLYLNPPNPEVSFGLLGSKGRVSIILPNAKSGRWNTSPNLTALHILSTTSVSQTLIQLCENRLELINACNRIVSYMCAIIHEQVDNYVDPSLNFLSRYWYDSIDDIMHSARIIFQSVLDRLSIDERREIAHKWSTLLKDNCDSNLSSRNKTKTLAVLVLGILGSEKPDSLTDELAGQVTMEMLTLLFSETSVKLRTAAVEILGKGFQTWSNNIVDISQVIEKLFHLYLMNDPPNLAETALHALMIIGAKEPDQFLRSIGKGYLSNSKGGPQEVTPKILAYALKTIDSLVKKHTGELFGSLPLLVGAVVRSLDPNVPGLREACLQPATNLVHDLVRFYPMVAFHQQTQRLAVGNNNLVHIYDVISATRWHTLDHDEVVDCLAFSDSGKMLASYSIAHSTVKLWKNSSSFWGLIGTKLSCTKTINLNPCPITVTPMVLLESVRLTWKNDNFEIFRAWEEGDDVYYVLN
eukprot:TRINITY_DN5476_c0_g2_i1.p1 TRINITY_DN5476_c0_g2~~TRINITY_DN5476_c0_g2_i1.p1  ORF type:complete len:1128 (-),score=210.08 TRINITY_DN5476_c0_g2_i1:80-3022(-)